MKKYTEETPIRRMAKKPSSSCKIKRMENRGYVSRLSTQVSLPYRRTDRPSITKKNGNIRVTFTGPNGTIPYGRYPRLFEIYLATAIKRGIADDKTHTIPIGSTFRGFIKLINVDAGGKQMRIVKQQIEDLLKSSIAIEDLSSTTTSRGIAFTLGRRWNIDWMDRREPQEESLFPNWIQLTEDYYNILKEKPVPINLEIIKSLRRPMSIDLYLWLQRRVSYLRQPIRVEWDQLFDQLGTDATLKHFKERIRSAIKDVREAWPDLRVKVTKNGLTIMPSATTIKTKTQHEIEWKQETIRRKHARELNDVIVGRIMEKSNPDDDHYVTARRIVVKEWNQGSSEDSIIETIKRKCVSATSHATKDATE